MSDSVALPRDPWFEENALMVAGRSVDNVTLLVAMAAHRANLGGPNRPPEDRNMRAEALEEVADCCNYVIWWIQRVREGLEAADPLALDEALSALAHVFGIIEALPTGMPRRRAVPRTHPQAGAKRTVRIGGQIMELREGGELVPYVPEVGS